MEHSAKAAYQQALDKAIAAGHRVRLPVDVAVAAAAVVASDDDDDHGYTEEHRGLQWYYW